MVRVAGTLGRCLEKLEDSVATDSLDTSQVGYRVSFSWGCGGALIGV